MTRSVEAWVGKRDDQAIPPRVRVRLFEAAGGRCQICSRKLNPGDKWQVDHILALANGGAHSEANMQVACDWCHKSKTREDVAEKAEVYAVRSKHVLPRKPSSWQSRGFPKREKQHRATGPIIRKSERNAQ